MPTSGNFSVNKLGQRGVAHLFLLFILLAGIVGGLVLIKNPKIFAPKAAPVLPDKPETSFELELEQNVGIGTSNSFFTDDPTPTSLAPDSKFRVDVYARSDIEAANLFSAKVKYSGDTVDFVSVEKREGQSFVKNWVDTSSDAGMVNLVGGVPNPGIKTDSKAGAFLMGSIIFKSKGSGTVKIGLSDGNSAIYSNASNINILTGVKGTIEVPIKIAQPSPTPSAAPALSCSGITVEGGIQVKDNSGQVVYYVVDSESKIKLTARVIPVDNKVEWTSNFSKNLSGPGTFDPINNPITTFTAPRNNAVSLEGTTIRADVPNPDKTKNPLVSCPEVTIAVKPVAQPVPSASPIPSSIPIVSKGPFSFNFENTKIYPTKFTCKKGDASCQLRVSFSAKNKLDKPLYDATFYTSNSVTDKVLVYRDFDGNEKSGKGIANRFPVESGASAISMSSIIFTPPVTNDTYYASLYLDGKTCNLNVTPRDCVFYGASSIDVRKTTSGETVTLEAINNSPAVQPSPTPGSLAPIITSVIPTSAAPGTWVVIKGDNFLPSGVDVASLRILLVHDDGGVATLATRLQSEYPPIWENTSIQFRIPQLPVQSGLLKVLVNNKFATAQQRFSIATYLLSEFLETFGLTSADPKFNAKYDYNKDGRVSVVDYSAIITLNLFDPKSMKLKTGYSVDELIPTYNKASTDAGFNAKYDVNSDKVVNKVDYTSLNQDSANGSGDGNNDGKVDFVDLSVLLTDYNKTQGYRPGIDIKVDGVINSFDFALMKNLLIQAGLVKSK